MKFRSPWTLIFAAVALGLPALIFRLGGIHISTEFEVAIFGLGILSAAFLISTGAEAAQHDIPAALAVALVAFIAVLPEYAVDLLLAWEAGKGIPGKDELALANMTGANRLLLGVGWATVIFLFAWKRAGPRQLAASSARNVWRSVRRRPADPTEPVLTLPGGIGLDIGILAIATLYSFVIVAKGRIAIEDTIVLGLLFLWYVVRLTRSPVQEPELQGPAAAIGGLPTARRRAAVTFVIAYSAAVIVMSAEPFVHGLEAIGRDLGIGEFFVIQWIAPLASESPEFFAALYLVWRGSAGLGINLLVSSKVNQWTLLIGSIPVAFMAAGGSIEGTDLQRPPAGRGLHHRGAISLRRHADHRSAPHCARRLRAARPLPRPTDHSVLLPGEQSPPDHLRPRLPRAHGVDGHSALA